MALTAAPLRLLSGPALDAGTEPYAAHVARLGPLPDVAPESMVADLEHAGLLGRGGAGFPAAHKWRAVARRSKGTGYVVANGAEGEPLSAKDQALLTLRPHLVIDGGILAARTVGASGLVIYVGTERRSGLSALARAIAERPRVRDVELRLVEAPPGYVSGESSAAVHYLNDGDARPTSTPPRPFERGLADRPTLVQNVETLAYAALIARFGAGWYREAGRATTRGTALVTVTGPVRFPGVREIEYGTPLSEVLVQAGGLQADLRAVLLGGYFGGWATADGLLDMPLDPSDLAAHGPAFGCGVIGLLPGEACGVAATDRILGYMAEASARQCGPCVYGLDAIAAGLRRLSRGTPTGGELANLGRWSESIPGRGACHHPDGAATLLRTALDVFAEEFEIHARDRRCSGDATVQERRSA